MNQDQLEALRVPPGTILRHKPTGLNYVVTGFYPDHITAVRSVEIVNPELWEVADPADVGRKFQESTTR